MSKVINPNKGRIFEVQPDWCRSPLPMKELAIDSDPWWQERATLLDSVKRTLFYDPTELYQRIAPFIDPFQRNPGISMDLMFPKLDLLCACGCGKMAQASDKFKEDGITPTWQRKWHNEACGQFANNVCSIINNNFQKPAKFISYYDGDNCSVCDSKSQYIGHQLDHLHGVKQGGGGAWLSNYKWKCHTCHVDKTNQTFGRKQYKQSNQEKLPL